jgi:hypothetical protein
MKPMGLALVVFLVLVGCAGRSASGGSGIDGIVVTGPQCPVERADSPCPDRPLADAHVVVLDSAGDEVASTRSDATGRFTVNVPPGTYALSVLGLEGIQSVKPVDVVVPQGRYVEATVVVDTGIR